MAEIKREPIKIKVGEIEYDAFDENHTISDIIRYANSQGDAQETVSVLSLMLDETEGKHND